MADDSDMSTRHFISSSSTSFGFCSCSRTAGGRCGAFNQLKNLGTYRITRLLSSAVGKIANAGLCATALSGNLLLCEATVLQRGNVFFPVHGCIITVIRLFASGF